MANKTIEPELVKGSDLPTVLARKFAVAPEEEVRVLLLRPRAQAEQRLDELLDEIGADAKRAGLTEEKLRAVLDGD